MSATPVNLRDISDAFRKADWMKKDFSYAKAYVCSIFSQWAYSAISELDLQQADLERFSLFNASEVYQQLINSRRKDYFEKFILEQSLADGGNNQRVELLAIEYDELWVFIAFRLQGIIFIIIRGTTLCARDVIDDLSIAQERPFSSPNDQCGFHRGFYHGTVNQFSKLIVAIAKKIQRPLNQNDTIYVMGHSLGGALSAVLHGYWNRRLYVPVLPPFTASIHSTYTFGMPRYGNKLACDLFETQVDHPHHVLNPWDGVPKVPPRALDYVDSQFEYSSVARETALTRTQWTRKRFLEGLLYAPTRISHHYIENYIKDIRKLI
jgi:predicted lipase